MLAGFNYPIMHIKFIAQFGINRGMASSVRLYKHINGLNKII